MHRALRQIGVEPPRMPGAADSSLAALRSLFEAAGLQDIATTPIEVTQGYRDFDDFWDSQTSRLVPTTKIIAALPEADRARLRECARDLLQTGPDGSVAYSSRANAVKARRPG